MTLVEGAIVLNVCLVLILGMLELGIAVLQHNELSEGARCVARRAIVRGSMCTDASPWGPAMYSGTAADGTEPAQTLNSTLVGVNPAEVQLQAAWLDGDNEPGSRVRVTINYQHKPLIVYLLGNYTIDLRAVSTMRIVH